MDDTIPEFWVLYSRSRLVIVIILFGGLLSLV